MRIGSSGLSIIDIHGQATFAGSAYKSSSYEPPMGQEFWLINADTLGGSVQWDFTNAPLSWGSWVTGSTNDGRDHWYIKRVP